MLLSFSPPVISSIQLQNFKRFAGLEIQNVKRHHAIMGPNGVGKTSVLWGLLLFLRAFNARCNASHQAQPSTPPSPSVSAEVAQHLCSPGLASASLNHFRFAHAEQGQKTAIKANVRGVEYTCDMDTQFGNFSITPDPSFNRDKIRFAFAGAEHVWKCPKEQWYPSKTINTDPSQRGRYRELSVGHTYQY